MNNCDECDAKDDAECPKILNGDNKCLGAFKSPETYESVRCREIRRMVRDGDCEGLKRM